MTRKEWMEQADEYQQKQEEAQEQGEEIAAELYAVKARACAANSGYGTVDEDEE